MPRPGRLIACPSCARHIQPSEPQCPHCGAAVRQADGSVQRTAAAILLGLTAAVAGCSDDLIAQPVYGTPATGGAGGTLSSGGSGGTGGAGTTTSTGTAGMGGAGGAGGGGGTAGMGGVDMPVYGAPATGGGGGTAGGGQ